MLKNTVLASGLLLAAAIPAHAQLDTLGHGPFFTGLLHPLVGVDHVLAMLTVGLWAAQQGGRAIWFVPLTFVATMLAGFTAAIMGLVIPFAEPVILASVIFFGAAVALALPVPTLFIAAMVGFFAFFHGHAHGLALGAADANRFALGFVIATAALHALGIIFAALLNRPGRGTAPRLAGGVAALVGLWLVT